MRGYVMSSSSVEWRCWGDSISEVDRRVANLTLTVGVVRVRELESPGEFRKKARSLELLFAQRHRRGVGENDGRGD